MNFLSSIRFFIWERRFRKVTIFNIKKLILVDKLDRRSLDAFAARAYFYLAFACENLDAEARKSGQPSSNLVLNCRGAENEILEFRSSPSANS